MSTSFESLIANGNRADQPAAGQPGRLYKVDDEGIVEKDNGVTWELFAVCVAGGAGTDTTAIHTDGIFEFDSIPEETSPASGDRFLIEKGDYGGKAWVDKDNLPSGGGGGGGITQEYLGYNIIGASQENMSSRKVYAKKITVAVAGLLNSIDVYIDSGAAGDQVRQISVAIYSDNSGDPLYIISKSVDLTTSILLDTTSGAGGNTNPRWLSTPISTYLPVGDYWIVVSVFGMGTDTFKIRYDGSGNDRYYTSGGDWFADWGFYTPSTSSNCYSIRASFIH